MWRGISLNIKYITLGAIFAAIAALFQLVPNFFSEMFVLMTVFSALPIYIISRINPKTGVVAYVVADFMVMLLSVHEGLLFLFTNGIIGLTLGICNYYIKQKSIIWIISSTTLIVSLCLVNYGIGIPVFGGDLPGKIGLQLSILSGFSLVYNIIFYYVSGFIYHRLEKLGFIDKIN